MESNICPSAAVEVDTRQTEVWWNQSRGQLPIVLERFPVQNQRGVELPDLQLFRTCPTVSWLGTEA
ncbi:MAG TPA: hypothetical protein PLP42_05605 [Acidobacteriota bacterium]|nr:hypothetical protein [Acidobacteriota bacterium]